MSWDALPLTRRAIRKDISAGQQLGTQLYVAIGDDVVIDDTIGELRPGTPLETSSAVPWYCCSKLVTTSAIALLCERGCLSLDDPVASYIPAFGCHGKESITLRHVLTHTSGIDGDPADGDGATPWDVVLDRVCSAPMRAEWVPGRRAAYLVYTGWFLLAEVIGRVDGRPPSTFEREEVLEPAGAHRSSLTGADPAYYRPGNSACGPVRDLAAVCRVLGADRGIPNPGIVARSVASEFTRVHREGLIDESLGGKASWGLGVNADWRAFGQVVSPGSFGHLGDTSFVFVDPESRVVVGAFCNGFPSGVAAMIRRHELTECIYRDLAAA